MDRGKTWTKYDLGDTDRNKLVWWSFTYTPELEGAYCLTVRATTESGQQSFETQTVMFNAKDKLPSPEETTVLELSLIHILAAHAYIAGEGHPCVRQGGRWE